MKVLTHRVAMRPWALAHGRGRGLHPWRRHAIGVGGHRGASHVGHGRREIVRSSMATRPSRHAMEVPVLSWTRTHPRGPVVLHTVSQQLFKAIYSSNRRHHICCQLTCGGWLLLDPEARGAPPWVLECPPPEVGTGASPSSAMRDRYSLSIRALSWAD